MLIYSGEQTTLRMDTDEIMHRQFHRFVRIGLLTLVLIIVANWEGKLWCTKGTINDTVLV